jgi:protein-histidine pros-kinase
MKSLAGRIFLILLVATVAIQALSFGGVLAFLGLEARRQMYDFMAADIAFVRNFVRSQAPHKREEALMQLNRGYYRFTLQSKDVHNDPFDDERLQATAKPVQDVLGADIVVRQVLVAGLNDKGLEIPIDEVHQLAVSFEGRDPPFSPPAPGVFVAYLVAIMLAVMPAAWLAVRLAVRPLSRLAAAARALGADLNAPQVPEAGTTEVAGAARAFNAMQRAIQKHLDERTQILASVSHDLKTPLTRLRLRIGNMAPAEQRVRCEADIDAMNALVQEGLDYAASAQVREQRVPLDLNRLVEDLAERAADVGARVQIRGRLSTAVQCAPRALERALQNLIDNAVKYGGGARIALADEADWVEVRVEDDGPGLPRELLERAFDPFFRAEHSRSRETGGTGLGLSIARNLIRAQGGDIELANGAAGGLVARVRLPRRGSCEPLSVP